jgi:hypothetical protein
MSEVAGALSGATRRRVNGGGAMNGQMMLFVPSSGDWTESLNDARDCAERTRWWILASPAKFKSLSAVVCRMAKDSAVRAITPNAIRACAPDYGHFLSVSFALTRNRNLWPSTARYLRALYPDVRGKLHLRKSVLDEISLPPIPYSCLLDGARCGNVRIHPNDWY